MSDAALPALDVRAFYDRFDAPLAEFDCGAKCSPHNPRRKPFCCDICQTVPLAYRQEWDYLQAHTDLWHEWRGDECSQEPVDAGELRTETMGHLVLLACRGPEHCQRPFRSSSCRQFPFFPYITGRGRFIGLAYEWGFEPFCWIISHLDSVSDRYRAGFVQTYDALFSTWAEEFECYADESQEMREHFASRRRRIPLLHRDGGLYLISPTSERLRRATPAQLPKFGPYQKET